MRVQDAAHPDLKSNAARSKLHVSRFARHAPREHSEGARVGVLLELSCLELPQRRPVREPPPRRPALR